MNNYKKLDSIICPLHGTNIIEASAGTGKTYNIENLYARLILQEGFTVDSILVVTFTEAATKELKERIRNILHDIQAFLNGDTDAQDRVKEIVQNSKLSVQHSTSTMQKRISSALINFDEAAIHTIHGFCNRILNDNSFESGILFNTELETNPEPIVQDIVEDFWRKEFYNADEFTNMLISYKGLKIEKLIGFVKSFISKEDIIIEPQNIHETNTAYIENEFDALLKAWNRNEVEEILGNLPLKQNSYKKSQISAACSVIDMLASKVFSKDTFKAVEKFSEEYIYNAIPKAFKDSGEKSPHHPFFKACSNFLQIKNKIELFDAAIKLKCRNFFNKEYAKRKSTLNIQTFDDLLHKTASQLSHNDSPLLKAIQEQFKAALIDEFQDTDSIQYNIFNKIFIGPNKPIFMVGDPKQAIYGFRGGDIFTYQKAKNDQSKKANSSFYTLEKNWRSSPNIVNAINSLFVSNERNPFPFVSEDIQFLKSEADNSNDNLRIDGTIDNKPFKLRLYSKEKHETEQEGHAARVSTQALKDECYEHTAFEICNLLNNKSINIIDNASSRNILPKDIAILVTTHEQARSLQPYLQELNIPSVMQSTGSVFLSEEAACLGYFLSAVAEPRDIGRIKAAMLSDLMGYTAKEIIEISESDEQDSFERILESFKIYHETWLNKSFIEMFNSFMTKYDLKNLLLQQINGERKLTNVLHLVELLHQQETDCKPGINGLLHWFFKRVDENCITNDEYEVRLESDSEAVRIMTIHKSKGLEFPIVFCPFMWTKTADSQKDPISKYHKSNDEFIIDISDNENAKSKSNDEQLEELLRLLYVAVTRSKYRCYLMWGNVDRKNSSALDYIFLADKSVADESKGGKVNKLSTIAKAAKKEGLKLDLSQDQKKHIDLIVNEKCIGSNSKYLSNDNIKSESLDFLNFPNKLIDYNWRITSFSSLAPHTSNTDIPLSRDHDEIDNAIIDDISIVTNINIYNFPAGAKTGTCWHEIFEELDFMAEDDEIRNLVIDKLALYNLNSGDNDAIIKEKQQVVFDMVKNVLNTMLSGSNTSLSEIDKTNRLSEMEFNFSLNNGLNTVDISNSIMELSEKFGFNNGIPNWKQMISGGFMIGFIDLIFRHNDKYYIIDWKSNKLDGTPEGFNVSGMKKEMAKHFYFLQYLIYTVALDKYLSCRIKDYGLRQAFWWSLLYIFARSKQ